MKLGISYNIFSGLELLEGSIKLIQSFASHINVVYQDHSNTGIKKPEIHDFVRWLYEKNYIDSAIRYTPNFKQTPKQNETNKRNIGLQKCKAVGCSHYMTMDTDEYYLPSAFKSALEVIETGKYDSSACKMQTYFKSTRYRLSPPEEYYVPFVYKIDHRTFKNGLTFPVKADPSRRMQPNKMKIFSRNELEMHHLSYVRDDIREKLYNASSSVNFKSRIEEIAVYYEQWKYPMKAYLGGSKKRMCDLEQIDEIF